MPLTDRDPNLGGRTSRASNFSISIKDEASHQPHAASLSTLPTGSSVLGMLKTTTETGDLGVFSKQQRRLPKIPNVTPLNRKPNGPALSRTSSHYSRNGSIRSKASNHSNVDQNMPGAWPHNRYPRSNMSDSGPRGDTQSSNGYERTRSLALTTFERTHPYDRAPSLTSTLQPSRSLRDHRSMTSLRSHESQHRPRSPYVYPSRLRRPPYRPASPALSDGHAALYGGAPMRRPGMASRAFTASPRPPMIYDQQYDHRRVQDDFHFTGGGGGVFNYITQMPPANYRGQPIFDGPAPQHLRSFPQIIEPPSPNFEDDMRAQYPVYPVHRTVSPNTPLETTRAKTPADTTPYVGFVHRVKTVLEERISMEDMQRYPPPRSPPPKAVIFQPPVSPPLAELSAVPIVRQLLQSNPPATSLVVSASLDAGPPDPGHVVSELEAHDPDPSDGETGFTAVAELDEQPTARLTREMIQAAIGPASDVGSSPMRIRSPFEDNGTKSPAAPSSIAIQDVGSPLSSSKQTYTVEHTTGTPSETSGNESAEATQDLAAIVAEHELSSVRTSTCSIKTFGIKEPESQPSVEPGYATLLDITQPTMSLRPCSYPRNLEPKHAFNLINFDRRVNIQSMPPSPNVLRVQPVTYVEDVTLPVVQAEAVKPAHSVVPTAVPNTLVPTNPPVVHQYVQPEMVAQEEIWRPSSSTQTQSWATPSILARRSFDPTAQASNRSTMSAHEAAPVDIRKSRTSTMVPPIPNRRSTRFSVPSEAMDAMMAAQKEGGITEPRYSSLRPIYAPLPDLTEDSQEDASTTNLRMLGSRGPPFRPNANRALRGEGRQLVRLPPVEPPSSYLSRNQQDTRGIPSFEFSHVDLTTKLNQALGLRSSKSMEDFRKSKLDFDEDNRTSLTQDIMKERYKSFFFPDHVLATEDPVSEDLVTKTVCQDDLIDEINNITIPSVNNLTARLSEMIPSVKGRRSELDLTCDEDGMRLIIDEIRSMGRPSRMDSLSSPALSPSHVPGDGTGGPIMNRIIRKATRLPHVNKDLPPLPTCPSIGDVTSSRKFANFDAMSDFPTVSRLGSRNDLVYEMPTMSPSMRSFARSQGKHSLEQRNAVSRTGSNATKLTGKLSYTRLKKSQSASTLRRDRSAQIVRSNSLNHDVSRIVKTTNESANAAAPGKTGLLDTLQRHMGKKSRIDRAGLPASLLLLHPDDRPLDPGDRYPTSSLTPPIGLNMEETRSFFSDDSSRSEQVTSLRKRITRLRPRRTVLDTISTRDVTSTLNTTTNWLDASGSVFGDSRDELNRAPEVLMFYEQPAVGMSRVEFRAKRVVEKIRSLWYRSGSFLRSIGGRAGNKHKLEEKPVNIRDMADRPFPGL